MPGAADPCPTSQKGALNVQKLALATVAGAMLVVPATAGADVVTDWNRTMVGAVATAGPPPPMASRDAAIVQSAVFDAVNGIARRYTAVHVPARGTAWGLAGRGRSQARRTSRWSFCSPCRSTTLDQRLSATLLGSGRDGRPSVDREGTAVGERPSPTRSWPGVRPTACRSCHPICPGHRRPRTVPAHATRVCPSYVQAVQRRRRPLRSRRRHSSCPVHRRR